MLRGYNRLAWSVEHVTLNPRVVSSSATLGMKPTLKKGGGRYRKYAINITAWALTTQNAVTTNVVISASVFVPSAWLCSLMIGPPVEIVGM